MTVDPFSMRIADAWIPPQPAKCVEWIPQHVIIPSETETPGPFDLDLFPHVRGVLEAIDDPMIRNIYLPWAARNAKTTTGVAIMLFFAVNMPRPSLLAGPNEEKTDDTIDGLVYPMAAECKETAPLLLPEHRRNKRFVSLRNSRIRKAFSGSPTSLAGYPACYALLTEVAKWAKVKSREADPLFLARQRAKLYPFDYKFIYESTPSLKGECNIWKLLAAPETDQRQRYVPCPHCGEYQTLVLGDKDDSTPGIKWERRADGTSDANLAEETAWYQCVNGCRIDNSDRAEMMRAGVWLSKGQTIDKKGRIRGEPVVSPNVGFGPLSSLYSLVISGWGQIAREFLEAKNDEEALRDFTNSTLGEVWDPAPRHSDPHTLAERLCIGGPAGVVPEWGRFLTVGIDVQEFAEEFVYAVSAWGMGRRGQEIAHGRCDSFDMIVHDVMHRQWPHQDGGPPMYISFGLMDSSHETEVCYELCRQVHNILPCKGDKATMGTEYRIANLNPDQRRNKSAFGVVELVQINTDENNRWIQKHLDGRLRAHDAPYHLSADSAFDFAFLDELLNERRQKSFDKRGHPQISWVRVTDRPNDLRDAVRYSKVAASIVTGNNGRWDQLPTRQTTSTSPKRAKRAAEDFAARDFQDDFSAR